MMAMTISSSMRPSATTQMRYVFCSNKCNEAFQKQYPIRIHKNCYERSCLDCDLCEKTLPGRRRNLPQIARTGQSVGAKNVSPALDTRRKPKKINPPPRIIRDGGFFFSIPQFGNTGSRLKPCRDDECYSRSTASCIAPFICARLRKKRSNLFCVFFCGCFCSCFTALFNISHRPT